MKKSVQTLFSRVGLTAVIAASLISGQVQAADKAQSMHKPSR